MNRSAFFNEIRGSLFPRRLSQSQVNGLDIFLDAAGGEYSHLSTPEHAYILATAFHETGGRMEPVREGFSSSDGQAIRRIQAARRKGRIKSNYIIPESGNYYYGRGYVQITWGKNYRAMGDILGIPLYREPDLALNPETAIKLIYEGMIRGAYTGRSLSDYFSGHKKDYYQARRIINGMDRARLIEGYAESFEKALMVAKQSSESFAHAQTGKPWYKSTTNAATGAMGLAGLTGVAKDVLSTSDDFQAIYERIKEEPLLIGITAALLGGAFWIFKERRNKSHYDGV